MLTLETIALIVFYVMMGVECLFLIPISIKYKWLDKPGKFIYYYLLSSIVFAVGSIICRYIDLNNMWLFAIMHYLQFFFISLFYLYVIQNFIIKIGIRILLVIQFFIVIADFFLIEGHDVFNSISVSIRNFALLIYAMIYFLQLMKDEKLIEKLIYINHLPSFWYNAGLFIYTCASFMFCLSTNYIQHTNKAEQNDFLIVMIFNYGSGIIQIIFFFIALLKFNRITKNNF